MSKLYAGKIDATPTKNIYQSIIADYDLKLGICELIDNVIDHQKREKLNKKVVVRIDFDIEAAIIKFIDNAGGVKKDNLAVLVSPGQSENTMNDSTIGLFGVGSKRAAVALAKSVKIKSRFDNQSTYQFEYDDEWIGDSDWFIEIFEISNIEIGTTVIELSKLRMLINTNVVDELRIHLNEVYAKFLEKQLLEIFVDETPITGSNIVSWSYPPQFSPKQFIFSIPFNGSKIDVKFTIGFSNKSNPRGEFGLSLYCNERLIKKFDTSKHVGYEKGKIGRVHPDISMVHAVIELTGSSYAMPWNSSKSEINYSHQIFERINEYLYDPLKTYSLAAKSFSDDLKNGIFKYSTGKIECITVENAKAMKSKLPEPNRIRQDYVQKIKNVNKSLESRKPYVRGLHEAIGIIDKIKKYNIDSRSRIAIIVLDSTLEISFKNFLVNDSGQQYTDDELKNIFKNRHKVHTEIKRYRNFQTSIDWRKIDYYYKIRNSFVHSRADMIVNDSNVDEFELIVQKTLTLLFGSNFNL